VTVWLEGQRGSRSYELSHREAPATPHWQRLRLLQSPLPPIRAPHSPAPEPLLEITRPCCRPGQQGELVPLGPSSSFSSQEEGIGLWIEVM
jgi:hypothetical protein